MSRPKVLAITKHDPDLCPNRSSLDAATLKLIIATNLDVAYSIIRNTRLRGIIICNESWSAEEREDITAELWMLEPKVAVILRCPGCVEPNELNRSAGTLRSDIPLTTFIAAIASPAPIKALI